MHGYIYSSILLNQEKVLTSLCQGYMCLSILLKRECILGMFRSMIDLLFARTRVYTFLILCLDFVERKSQKRKIRKNPSIARVHRLLGGRGISSRIQFPKSSTRFLRVGTIAATRAGWIERIPRKSEEAGARI